MYKSGIYVTFKAAKVIENGCGASYVDLFCYLCFSLLYSLVFPCSLVITGWERDDLLALLCVMFIVYLSLSHMVFRARFST